MKSLLWILMTLIGVSNAKAQAISELPPERFQQFFFDRYKQGKQEVYRQDFNDDSWTKDWDVKHADAAAFHVKDGALFITASQKADWRDAVVPNLFQFKGVLPAGEWMATITFKADIVNDRERLLWGVLESPLRYASTQFYQDASGVTNVGVLLRDGKHPFGHNRSFYDNNDYTGYRGFEIWKDKKPSIKGEKTMLRIVKLINPQGQELYGAMIRMDSWSDDLWLVTRNYKASTAFHGLLSFAYTLYQTVKPASTIAIDSISIVAKK